MVDLCPQFDQWSIDHGWRLCAEYTQAQVGEALGWSRETVKDYIALDTLDKDAWTVISATFAPRAMDHDDDAAPDVGAGAPHENKESTTRGAKKCHQRHILAALKVESPFTENLLRHILDLTPAQQLELCTWL